MAVGVIRRTAQGKETKCPAKPLPEPLIETMAAIPPTASRIEEFKKKWEHFVTVRDVSGKQDSSLSWKSNLPVRAKNKIRKDYVLILAEARPDWTLRKLGKESGLSRTEVQTVLRLADLPFREERTIQVLALAKEHPDWSFEKIAKEVGWRHSPVRKILKNAGFAVMTEGQATLVRLASQNPGQTVRDLVGTSGVTRNEITHAFLKARLRRPSIRIFSEKRKPSERWLEEKGIARWRNRKVSRYLADLQNRYRAIQETYGYRVRSYDFLCLKTSTLKTHIENLDRHSIDWKDENKGLQRLAMNSPRYVNAQVGILKSVGASEELHYLLLKSLVNKTEVFNREKHAALRAAVIEKDMDLLFKLARRMTRRRMRLDDDYPTARHVEASRDVLLDVFYNCSSPQNNPAAVLALIAAAIEVKILQMKIEERRSRNIDDYRGITADENIKPRRRPTRQF